MSAAKCTHVKDHVKNVKPHTKGCGKVGCCDSSKNRHATAHFHGDGHPIMRSVEPGEDWRWCYIDQTYI